MGCILGVIHNLILKIVLHDKKDAFGKTKKTDYEDAIEQVYWIKYLKYGAYFSWLISFSFWIVFLIPV